MVCKCTAIDCNPCTNVTRILDICPECYLLGHVKIQTTKVTSSNVAFKKI